MLSLASQKLGIFEPVFSFIFIDMYTVPAIPSSLACDNSASHRLEKGNSKISKITNLKTTGRYGTVRYGTSPSTVFALQYQCHMEVIR
jgi:hypothetical protein